MPESPQVQKCIVLFPVTTKSAHGTVFPEVCHGHFFVFKGTFWKIVTGNFKCHGNFLANEFKKLDFLDFKNTLLKFVTGTLQKSRALFPKISLAKRKLSREKKHCKNVC